MATFPGESHDAWNAIRTAAKKRGGGRVWKAVVRMASIQNLPYGPYRSGAWGRQMQSAHHQSMDEVTADSEEFHEAVDLHVLIDPLRYGGADKDQYFKYFGRLPCCVRPPEVLKFARWHSVESCWKELRKDIALCEAAGYWWESAQLWLAASLFLGPRGILCVCMCVCVCVVCVNPYSSTSVIR